MNVPFCRPENARSRNDEDDEEKRDEYHERSRIIDPGQILFCIYRDEQPNLFVATTTTTTTTGSGKWLIRSDTVVSG